MPQPSFVDSTIYHLRQIALHRVSEAQVLLTLSTGTTLLLPAFAREVINACRTPRTLRAHLQAVQHQQGFIRGIRHNADHILITLVQAGILVKRDDLVRCFSSSKAASPANISTHVVVTADRPVQCLATIEDSYSQLTTSSRPKRIIVVDGSASPTQQARLEASLSASHVNAFCKLEYYGPSQREAFCDRLFTNGIGRDVSASLLLEHPHTFSAGSARNFALMMTLGESILMFDDDVRMAGYSYGDARADLSLYGHELPRFIRSFDTRDEAISAARHQGMEEVLSGIRRLLGRTLSQVLLDWNAPVTLEQACAHQTESIILNDGNIPCVQLGSVGDSAMHTADWIGMLGPAMQEQLQRSEAVFRTATTSREAVNIQPGFAVTHTRTCMSFALGLDNSSPLPPFMPHYRNEDGVFGYLLGSCWRSAYSGYVPFGLLHDADRPRTYQSGTVLRAADFVILAIEELELQMVSDVASNYTLVGSYFCSLGKGTTQDMTSFLQRWALKAYAIRLSFIASALLRYPRESAWRSSLVATRRNIYARLSSSFYHIPSECLVSTNHDVCVEAFQHFVHSFGRGLYAWETIKDAARDSIGTDMLSRTGCGL